MEITVKDALVIVVEAHKPRKLKEAEHDGNCKAKNFCDA